MLIIALGLCLLIFLVSKQVNFIIVAPAVIMLIAVGNGINPYLIVTGAYAEGIGYFIQSFFLIFLLGTLFGKVMEQSGAAYSIGRSLVCALGKKHATTAVFFATLILCAGGISAYVITFTLFPLGQAIFEQSNLPRRLLVPCIGAGAIVSNTLPASPQIPNFVLMEYLNTSPTAGFLLGIASFTISVLFIVFYLEKQAGKARFGEDGFVCPSGYVARGTETMPPVWIACVPLLLIVILLSVLGIDPVISLGSGVGAAYLLLIPWTPIPMDALNEGAKSALMPLLLGSSSVGFGLALKTVPSFVLFIEKLIQSSLHPIVLAAATTSIAAGMMGSATGGLVLTFTTVGQELTSNVNPELLHRVMVQAAAGLDTLPHNNGYLTLLAFSGLTFRETYKDFFITTLVAPIIGLAVILTLFFAGVPA